MKYTKINISVIWIGLFLGIVGLFTPKWSAAFSGVSLPPSQVKCDEIQADIMEVNIAKSYVVIAEKRFDVTEYKIGDEIYKTVLKDADGKDITLKSLKKGRWVVVKGIKISKYRYIADSIQIIPAPARKVKQNRFIPKARSIAPLR